MTFFAICAGLGLLAACASVPEVDASVGRPSDVASRPTIIGSHGPLTAKQSKALLDRLSAGPRDAGILKRHLAIEEAIAETPLIAGNRTRILRDGPETFHAMFDAIRGAKDHINLEYYILEDVESDGQYLGDLLVAKRRANVAVNVIYDSYGSGDTPQVFFDRLKQAGVNFVDFNPINPLDADESYALNNRDHRKILVVDGALAIVGGINLSTAYQSHSLGKSGAPEDRPTDPWRDTDLLIEGPAVAQLQALFLDQWAKKKGAPLTTPMFFPTVPPKGAEVVRIIGSTPDNATPQYYVTLLSALRSAEKSISVTAAYFVPTHQEMEALLEAARRGINVRLLLPDRSDSERAIDVAHSHYSDLLEAGVKIYETHGVVLHSKTVIIDGVWSAVGSSNFDHRSVLFNDEIDAVVVGSETAQALEQMFDDDVANANQIDSAAWAQRPLQQKMQELMSRAVESLL